MAMRFRRSLTFLTAGVLVALLAAGCGSQAPPAKQAAGGNQAGGAAPAQAGPGQAAPAPAAPAPAAAAPVEQLPPLSPPVKVTIGMKGTPSDAGALIGMARGYYKELGLELEAVQFKTGQDMINALATGHLDVGFTVTSAGLFNAFTRGVDMKIVADKGYNVAGQGYYRLVVRKDLKDQIKDFKDLKGRPVAIVGAGSLDEIALDRVLRKGGMSTKDVDLKIIGSFPDLVVALGNKAIDAGMLIEPFITQGADKGVLDPWKDPAEYEDESQTAIIVYGSGMAKKPEVARRFMVAYLKALRDYNDAFFKNRGRDEMVKVLAETSTVKDADLLGRMIPAGLNPNGYVRVKGIQSDIDWYVARGLIPNGIDVKDVVDHSYIEAALKVIGTYQ